MVMSFCVEEKIRCSIVPSFSPEFILFPVDHRPVHPPVIITFTRIMEIGIVIGIPIFITIKNHRYTTQEKTMRLHENDLSERQFYIMFAAFLPMLFPSPHNEASEPLIRASCVFGLTENKAPLAGESSWLPE